MINIPANAKTYFLEELAEVLPTQVVYEHDSGGDLLWWNIAYVYDSLSKLIPSLEPLQKFVQSVSATLREHPDQLGKCIYIKPSNADGGSGLLSKREFVHSVLL